jgi:hypothetical protein
MTSISVPARLYAKPALRVVETDEVSAFVRPFRKHRRSLRSIRERALYDPLYIRHQIV